MRNDTIICSYTVYVFFSRLFCFFFRVCSPPNHTKKEKRRKRRKKLCPRKNFESNISKAINFIIFSLSLLRSFSCMMVELKLFLLREMKTTSSRNRRKRNSTNNKKCVIRKSTKSNFTLAFDNETIARISFFAFCAKKKLKRRREQNK